MDIKNILTRLADTHCAAHVNGTANVVYEILKDFCDVKVYDNYVLAEIGKTYKKSLLLEAHIDQISMIVTNVYDDGFLRVAPVGGIDSSFLPSTSVVIYGKRPVKGVFTSVPPHLKKDDTVCKIDELFVDTGKPNLKETVGVGDLVFFDYKSKELLNDNFTAVGLDNKAGCTAVINAMKNIKELNLPIHVSAVFSFGEELGLRGAKVASYSVEADLAVVVDVSFGEAEGVPSYKTAKLGSGAMIGVSPILSRDIYKTLLNLAEKNSIPYTHEVMGAKTGTNADVISISKSGIPTGLVSIPLKNMHTSVEVVSLDDINSVSSLLVLFAKEVAINA